jgi:LysM repeat protein/lysophospholipase L1-like esterase
MQTSYAQKTGMKSIRLGDTLAEEEYVSKFVRYQRYLPFIKYDENYVEWNTVKAIENFFVKLANANSKKVNILHIGDSHLQADFYTGYVREHIQEVFGYGGRGFIFPYACAGTHSTYDYRTWKYGKWEGARNVKNPYLMDIGITGAVARTYDSSAGFKFGFKEGILKPEFTVMKIYCKKSEQSFNLKLKLNNYDDTIYLKTNVRPNQSFVRIDLPVVADTFEVFVDKTDSFQNFFECYGMMIESCKDKGVVYNSVGINGAGYSHLLTQTLFDKQIEELKPDLVVIDLGANDFYGYRYDKTMMEANLKELIHKVKKASPQTSVLISCSQDIYYRRRRNIYATYPFSKLIQSTAKEEGAAWYDYYSVSGGRYSMLKWRRYRLAKRDKVHLTTAGYHVKGDLYLNALLSSYVHYLKERPDNLLVANGGLKINVSDSLFIAKDALTDIENDSTKRKIIYKVRKGEHLRTIARRHNVDQDDIMDWNGLERYYLYWGQKLVIYVDKDWKAPVYKAPAKSSKKRSVSTKGRKTYKVRSGDTLWAIAQANGVTVSRIKRLNNMRNSKIWPGQKLIIR